MRAVRGSSETQHLASGCLRWLLQSVVHRTRAQVSLVIGPDLLGFVEAGQPLWDGDMELLVREANPKEVTRWEQGFAEAEESASREQDPEDYAVFLVDVDEE